MSKHPWAYLAAILLLILFMAQAVGNLTAQSPVVDEPSHIARAMAYWRVGDLRLQLGHPPLMHALAGLPLLLEPGVPDVSTLPGWQEPFDRGAVSQHALWDPERPTDRIVFLARWPVLMLALLLGALTMRWAGERFGVWAALIALFLFSFDPNVLAHAVLITTDLIVTFSIVLSLYTFDRWLRRRSILWLALSGVTLGLALVSKFTAIILVPLIGLLGLIAASRDKRWRHMIAVLVMIGVIGALVVWVVYRFEMGQFKPIPFNAPAPDFLQGVLRVQARDEEGRMAFLFGQMQPRGWWYYFPVALAVKTPLPTLVLIGATFITGAMAVFRLWKQRGAWRSSIEPMLPLMLLPLALLGVSMRSTLNVGYRHILPILPFLFILISGLQPPTFNLQSPISNLRPRLRGAALVAGLMLGAWLIAEAFLIYPYHLAYFNEAAGGPGNGFKILADSNVDWGQDVKRLKAWLDAHSVQEVYLSLFTGSVPERYGIRALPLPGPYESVDAGGFRRFTPAPGWYAISSSAWQGLRFHNPDTFDWFRRQKPVARIGHSLFVYHVLPSPDDEKWAAVCYSPDGPIDGAGLAAGFGRTDMRSIFFDCRRAWVYVHDGGPGYYVVPARGEPTIAAEMMLGRAVPVYHDRGDPIMSKDRPGFTLDRWDGQMELTARMSALIKPPGDLVFDPASLIGYEMNGGPWSAGGTITLTLWWRANAPGEVLLSSYAHLMNGERLVGSDGLGVPPQMWQAGDVIVERYVLPIPRDWPPGDSALHVGLYSAESGKRYALRSTGDEHPQLTTVPVGK
jgi:hypothetical protein